MRSLWLRFFLQTIGILRYKILRLVVEKHHFIMIIGPHVAKTTQGLKGTIQRKKLVLSIES
jgi:hypothetical protein